jgi:tetratricopeptide (TPR) repeat protein
MAVPTGSADYEKSFQAAFRFAGRLDRRLAIERLRGWGQWAALEPLQPEERLSEVVSHLEYQHWGLFRALLDAARWYGFRDPRGAVDIVQLALDTADLLDPREAGGELEATDLRAQGHAVLGNTRRMASDFDGARSALNEAWRLNELGTGNPLEKAQIISLDASWIKAMGEFETAESVLGEALSIYQSVGDAHMQGRILLQMGEAIGWADPDKGIAYIERALEKINPAREPRLELCAQHDLAHFLSDAGRSQEALAVLERARPLYDQFTDDWTQLRLHWIQGRIARQLGHLADASHIFRQVADQFRSRAMSYPAVMASLDLAESLAAAGELASASRLVGEIHPLMAAWGVKRPLAAAWLFLQQALDERRKERDLASLFTRLTHYYRRNWYKPADFMPE